MDEPQVFLSYNSLDRKAVDAVRNLLRARGITTFLDRDNLVRAKTYFTHPICDTLAVVQEDHKIAPLDESSSRQIWVGWGSGIVCLGLAYIIGGLFFPYVLVCFGATMALRGHLPGLFATHIEARLIAGTPYRRKESIKSWGIALLACLLLAGVASSIHRRIAPEHPDLAKTILDGVKRLMQQQKVSTPTLDKADTANRNPNKPFNPPTKQGMGVAPDPSFGSIIGHLSQLGWTVKNEKGYILFEVANRPLPDMKQSSSYFMALRRRFRLQFQQVPSIVGLNTLSASNDCDEITISASDISDLSELHGLKSLRKLNIYQTPLTTRNDLDISPLATLVNLESLGLSGSRVKDIEPLRELTKLATLSVGHSLVRDLSPIKGLRLLKSVDVRDSGVSDLSVLDGAEALEELSIDEKQVPSLTHLSRLTKLKKLSIMAKVPIDTAAVGTLPNLESLFIWGPPVIDLSPLRKLLKLNSLTIGGSVGFIQIIDADAIGGLAQLTTLNLINVQIDSLHFLVRLNNLAELQLNHMPIGSVSELEKLGSLKKISLVDVPVVDISPLLSLPNLEKLLLQRTPARADVIAELERRGVLVSNP